jgi:hypothetical protein
VGDVVLAVAALRNRSIAATPSEFCAGHGV